MKQERFFGFCKIYYRISNKSVKMKGDIDFFDESVKWHK